MQYINDKRILKSSLNFTSQFTNFKEIISFGEIIADKLSKELKSEIENATEDSTYIIDWIGKIRNLST